jgi:hypothetical protein
MKALTTLIIIIGMSIGICSAQTSLLTSVNLMSLEGKAISGSDLLDSDSPAIIVFWSPSEQRSIEQLVDIYDKWMEEMKGSGIRLIAISVDCSSTFVCMNALRNGNDLTELEAYVDRKNELKTKLGIVYLPYTYLVNNDQEFVATYTGFMPGIENIIWDRIELAHLDRNTGHSTQVF